MEANAIPTDQVVEELKATLQMKDHLLQMVSHEMRTPLMSITNFSSTMLDSWELISDDDKKEYLEIVSTQATRLQRLVNDLLAVARLEAGRLRTVTERVELRAVAQETIAELAPDSGTVAVLCPEDLAASADRDHVKQVLVNLLSNALKYGEAPVEIDAEPAEDEMVSLWVADRGEGISDEFRPHLFEKFAQQETAHQQTGSGLGLSIVQGLAHAQHGRAWYAHRDGSACFGITVPRF